MVKTSENLAAPKKFNAITGEYEPDLEALQEMQEEREEEEKRKRENGED